MELEKQVCNLELSKKLKELGVKQESLFYYLQYADQKPLIVGHNDASPGWSNYSAFTVAELGEMLPEKACIRTVKLVEEWCCDYHPKNSKFNFPEHREVSNIEADARAKMLVYLLENKLIKV